MKVERFEDLIAWQKAEQLTLFVYLLLKENRDFNYKKQIERAAVSVMNNIAEGFERKTNNEFKNFLFIAKGSCGEVRSMLHLGLKLNYIYRQNYEKAYNLTIEISRILSGLIKSI
ncbi:MAG: four helix bundle protein [bacterium]